MAFHNKFIDKQNQLLNELAAILKADSPLKEDDQALKDYLQYGVRSKVSDQLELDQRSAVQAHFDFLEKFRRFVRLRLEQENLEYQNFNEKQKLKNQQEQEDAFENTHRQSPKTERQNLLASFKNTISEFLALLAQYKSVTQESLNRISETIKHARQDQKNIITRRFNPLLARWSANVRARGYVYRPQRPSAPPVSLDPAIQAFFGHILPQHLKDGTLTEENLDQYLQSLQQPRHDQPPQPVPSAPSAADVENQDHQQPVPSAPFADDVEKQDKQQASQASYDAPQKQEYVYQAPKQESEPEFYFADSLRDYFKTNDLYSDFSAKELAEYTYQVGQAINHELSDDEALQEGIRRSVVDYGRNQRTLAVFEPLETVVEQQRDSIEQQIAESESALLNPDALTNDQLYQIEKATRSKISYFGDNPSSHYGSYHADLDELENFTAHEEYRDSDDYRDEGVQNSIFERETSSFGFMAAFTMTFKMTSRSRSVDKDKKDEDDLYSTNKPKRMTFGSSGS